MDHLRKMKMDHLRKMNHYDYLTKNIFPFLEKCGVNPEWNGGIISAHGDKAYGYRYQWNENGLHFFHGVAIYLLTYCRPYSQEVRETENGWVDPGDWVLKNKDRFLKFLPPVEDVEEE